LLLTIAVGYYFLTHPSQVELAPEVTPPTKQLAPEVTPPTTQPPPSFEQKIENFRKEVEDACIAGESKEVALVITKDEANSKIAPLLARVEIPEDIPLEIESIHIDFKPDTVITALKVATYGITLTIEVEAQINIRDGKPEVEIVDIDFGWIPLPKLIEDQITGLLTQKIEDLQTRTLNEGITAIGDVDWEVTEVNIQERQSTVTLVIKPKTTTD